MGQTLNYGWNYGYKGKKPWWTEWENLWNSVDTELYTRSKDLLMNNYSIYNADKVTARRAQIGDTPFFTYDTGYSLLEFNKSLSLPVNNDIYFSYFNAEYAPGVDDEWWYRIGTYYYFTVTPSSGVTTQGLFASMYSQLNIDIDHDTGPYSCFYGGYFMVGIENCNANIIGELVGLVGGVVNSSPNTDIPLCIGVRGNADGHQGQITDVVGIEGRAGSSNSSDHVIIDNAIGVKGACGILGISGGTTPNVTEITNFIALLAERPFLYSGDVSIINAYGVYVEDFSGGLGTNKWNIYSSGANALNYFEGQLQVSGHSAFGNDAGIDKDYMGGIPQKNILDIREIVTDLSVADFNAGFSWTTINPSANWLSHWVYGLNNFVITDVGNSKNGAGFVASFNETIHMGSGTIGLTEAGVFIAGVQGLGIVSDAKGLEIGLYASGGGSIIDGYAIYIWDTYGQATNAWNIYSAGANSRNFFEGHVHVGGDLEVGAYSAKGAEAFQGFLTIKDNLGNSRKVMVCA